MEETDRCVEKEDVEFSEDPELEDPECMDDKEEDPDWHCQLEDKGECDTGADDEEKENSSMNTIRQVLMITCSCQWLLFIIHFLFSRRKAHVIVQ